MNTIDQENLFAHAVARVSRKPNFMANIFARYQALEGISKIELAEHLGCSLANYYRLALCHTPSKDCSFVRQVKDIATYGHASALKLEEVFRRVEATSEPETLNPQH